MDCLKILPGSRRSPPGLERRLLRRLPVVALGGTLVPLFFAIASHLFPPTGLDVDGPRHLQFVDMLVIATIVTHWAAVLTVALGCVVVILMKGPAYVADRYDLDESDPPRSPSAKTR